LTACVASSLQADLKAFCARTHTTLLTGKRWSKDVTHVICNAARRVSNPSCASGSRALTSRSLKYMQGVLQGVWVVEWAWVAASMERGHWVAETDFEVAGDVSILSQPGGGAVQLASPAPRRMRLREAQGLSRLLRNIKIAVDPRMAKIDPAAPELQFLIQIGQGILIPTPAALLPENSTSAAAAGTDANGVPNAAVDGGASTAAPTAAADLHTTALLSSGVSRLPAAAAAAPGPIYLLCRSDAAVMYPAADMARLGGRFGMLPLSVQWLMDSISLGVLQDPDLFRADFTQEQKAEIRKKLLAATMTTTTVPAAATTTNMVAPAAAPAVLPQMQQQPQQQDAQQTDPTPAPPAVTAMQQTPAPGQATLLLAPIGS
jgi:hypothetical protein